MSRLCQKSYVSDYMRKRKSQGRKTTCEQPPSLLHRGQQVKTLKNSNFHRSRYEDPLVQPSSLSLNGCVVSTESSLLVKRTNQRLPSSRVERREQGFRNKWGNNCESPTYIVYKRKGRSGRGGACLPASSSACILPQPSTCSVISTQQITLRSHEVPQASLTHQASKPNFQGKLTLQKAGEKGRLIKFPWPPFLTTSFRSEAQRQVPICKAAPGNTWPVAPTQWKGSRLWKRLLKCQQWECFSPRFLDKSFTSWWTPILQAYIKT